MPGTVSEVPPAVTRRAVYSPLDGTTPEVYKADMRLDDFIRSIGDEAAADLFEVRVRTAASWRRRERIPSPVHAQIIVARSPVTFKGIYQIPELASK